MATAQEDKRRQIMEAAVRAFADDDRHRCAPLSRAVCKLLRGCVRRVHKARRHALAHDAHRRDSNRVARVRVGSHTSRLARRQSFLRPLAIFTAKQPRHLIASRQSVSRLVSVSRIHP